MTGLWEQHDLLVFSIEHPVKPQKRRTTRSEARILTDNYNINTLHFNIINYKMLTEITYSALVYFMFSMTEWVVHKYIMHGDKDKISFARDHITHHIHTLPDMKLTSSDSYGDSVDKYLGLYFIWHSSFVVFLVGCIECFILSYITGLDVSAFFIVSIVSLFCLYQSSFWNTIHPDIHEIPLNLSWNEGIPGWNGWNGWKQLFGIIMIDNMSLYEWLKANHRMHHVRKGVNKGNYNVTLPGADFIFGTYYKD